MTRQELRVFLDSIFCGCGDPEAAAGAILRLLALHERSDDSWAKQMAERDQWLPDDGVQMLLLYWLDRLELTEHGGGVGGAWLTTKGQDVLAALREEQDDDFEALFAMHCVHGYDVGDNHDTSHECT